MLLYLRHHPSEFCSQAFPTPRRHTTMATDPLYSCTFTLSPVLTPPCFYCTMNAVPLAAYHPLLPPPPLFSYGLLLLKHGDPVFPHSWGFSF